MHEHTKENAREYLESKKEYILVQRHTVYEDLPGERAEEVDDSGNLLSPRKQLERVPSKFLFIPLLKNYQTIIPNYKIFEIEITKETPAGTLKQVGSAKMKNSSASSSAGKPAQLEQKCTGRSSSQASSGRVSSKARNKPPSKRGTKESSPK